MILPNLWLMIPFAYNNTNESFNLNFKELTCKPLKVGYSVALFQHLIMQQNYITVFCYYNNWNGCYALY